ncbi:hypothetical protein [Paraburkholderia sp. J8-2]|uniref:hypothetical protein n=1 Tax=Paraburkholderia sp. J8-2 TaxID=2805440 RepID=UPI002AB784C0|nr:hypothetical protein [Paraburkholderia sp. J8-2]
MLAAAICVTPMIALAILLFLVPDGYFHSYQASLKRRFGFFSLGVLCAVVAIGLAKNFLDPTGPLVWRALIGLAAVVLPAAALVDNFVFWLRTYRRRPR